ncbi:Ig-like domain-containing protein, partial [Salmonella enterica]|uniref:Ig-like domain-containing protein n=1 Tax=Salmonella enterica TaxID=28901 RepID=UPI00398C4676
MELVHERGITDDDRTKKGRPNFQGTVPTDVNVVRLSIDGGKTWFNATQSATPGVWHYCWPDVVAYGGNTLTLGPSDEAVKKATKNPHVTLRAAPPWA